jgi:hypothetical protein
VDHLDDVRKHVYITLIELTFYDGAQGVDVLGRHLTNDG